MCDLEKWYTAAAKSLQLCPTLCDPRDGSPPGSAIPGILQARTLEWVAISFFQCLKVKSESEVSQLYPTLSDPMDCSPPGSSVHGIFQARVLEWGAIAFSEKNGIGDLICKAEIETQGFPGDSVAKNLPAISGDTGSIPDLGRFNIPWSN